VASWFNWDILLKHSGITIILLLMDFKSVQIRFLGGWRVRFLQDFTKFINKAGYGMIELFCKIVDGNKKIENLNAEDESKTADDKVTSHSKTGGKMLRMILVKLHPCHGNVFQRGRV